MKRLSRTSFRLSAKDPDKDKGSESAHAPGSPPAMRDLQEFLTEAELSEYYTPLLTRLKVSTVEHLKYVREEDLEDIGMTKPEMRRLKKFYKKEFPQGAISKLRKAILKGGGDAASRTLSPSPPTQRSSRPVSVSAPIIRTPGKQLIPLEAIQLSRTLGEGEFGVVQQGVWTAETGDKFQVAVKRLRRERMNTDTQNFLKDAAFLQDLEHDHIIQTFGVVLDADDNIMLVTELAPMRSLLECLKDPTLRIDLPVPRLCDYAQQVCDGMSYLENKRLVHRDLAARNILVFNKNQVKISDLGLSRILGAGQDYYQSKFSVSLKLPIAWCAPECINFLTFTSASDVWSFGVLLWEFFTYGFQPWAGLNGQQILEAVDSGQHLDQPDLCTSDLYKLMKKCWSHEPEDRPAFADILLKLPQLRPTQVKALKDYPNPMVEKGYLNYKAGDVIVVIDKSPASTSPPGLVWRGVLVNGKSGLFDPTNAVPFIETKYSPVSAKAASIARKESSRKSGRKIRADMISHPQNDLRHTGHIGYDGAVFGDVSFIGDNYDKLPVKVGAGGGSSRGSSVMSLSHDSPDHNGHIKSSGSQDSLDNDKNVHGRSWISQESLQSHATFQSESDGHSSSRYMDTEDDSLFSDFKIPDLGSSFDFGPSFMDEVLKALDEKEKQIGSAPATNTSQDKASSERVARPAARAEPPPIPAPRESRSSTSSGPPATAPRPRVEPPREKKQATVKPMSAEERVINTEIAGLIHNQTSHVVREPFHSPSVSPSLEDKFSLDDHATDAVTLRNHVKQPSSSSGSSRNDEHKQSFLDELDSREELNGVGPAVQHSYSVSKSIDSVQVKSPSGSKLSDSASYDHKEIPDSWASGAQASLKSSQDVEPVVLSEPDLIRDSKGSSVSARVSGPTVISSVQLPPDPAGLRQTSTASAYSSHASSASSSVSRMSPAPPEKPTISAPQPLTKPLGLSQPKPSPISESTGLSQPRPNSSSEPVGLTQPKLNASSVPVPAPRPAKAEVTKRSEIPVPRPRPEIQRVEPTVRQTVPASPDIPPKNEKRIDSHIPVPASKEREREELKRTIEVVRMDDSGSLRDDASTSFDHSSAQSSQRSSMDRSDNTSENTETGHADWDSSDSSRLGRDADARISSSIDRKDSFNKKQASLFEEDLSAPSPQEIMSKLRERRLNRHMDHQRGLAGESEGSRPRPTAREPQGIPGRGADNDEGAGGDAGSDEVDTNPLRMLRGGAIPIRTAGRGSAARRISKR